MPPSSLNVLMMVQTYHILFGYFKVMRFLLRSSVLDLIVRHGLSVIITSLLLFTDPSAAVISVNVTESVETINGRERITLIFQWRVCHIHFNSLLVTLQAIYARIEIKSIN